MAGSTYTDKQWRKAAKSVQALERATAQKYWRPPAGRRAEYQHIVDELRANPAGVRHKIATVLTQFMGGAKARSILASQRQILESIRTSLLFGMTNDEGKQIEHLPLAFVRTGDPNAFAIRTPAGPPAILLDWDLARFINVANKVSLFTSHLSDDKIRRLMENNVAKFVDPTGTFFETPKCPDFASLSMLAVYTKTHESFVVAHEYGHILSGHLDTDLPSAKRLVVDSEVEEYARSRDMEFEADRKALALCRAAAEQEFRAKGRVLGVKAVAPEALTFIYPTIEALFVYFEILERLAGSDLMRSHPSALERRRMLRSLRPCSVPAKLDVARITEQFYFLRIFPEWSSSVLDSTEAEGPTDSGIGTEEEGLFCDMLMNNLGRWSPEEVATHWTNCPICRKTMSAVYGESAS